MTANQRKKRVNAASLVGCSSYKQYMVKRRKLKLPQPPLKMAPTISLEWDNKKKSVVSKRDQIGISQRRWIPFTEPGPHSHDILADAFSVPQDIFELENLSDVLSYEVWQSLLSKNERSFLSQFLPKEAEPDTIVQELLAGDNFHFGNPFLIWGASLCFGELHPDKVLREEQSLKACKKTYYLYLQKYHNDMIGNLQLWKEKLASGKDPEVDVVHKIWRTRYDAEKSMPLSDTGIYDAEESLVATPDSCSWANSDKECGSDNQNWEMVHADFERRKDSFNKTGDSALSRKKVAAISIKGGKLHKHNIQREDGAKYMSYVKVSKQQHERVKSSMKHAGNSIQPRSLNNVLGTIDALNVQPFEKFEEEEEKKLRDYWLKLVKHDIPGSFINWRKCRLSKQLLTQSLGEELGNKVKPEEATLDKDREGSPNNMMERSDDNKYEFLPAITIEGMEKEQIDDMLSEQRDNEKAIDEIEQGENIRKKDYAFEEQAQDTVTIEHGDIPDHVCIQDHHKQQVASIDKSSTHSAKLVEPCNPVVPQDKHQRKNGSVNVNLQIKPDVESLVNTASADINVNPALSAYSNNLSHTNVHLSQQVPLTSSSDVWPTSDVRGSYYQSIAASDEYASSQELKLGKTQFLPEQPLRILDIETERQDKVAGKDMLSRRSDHTSFFSSYSNEDRSEPHSLFKGQNSLSYHHEQKHLGLDFQHASDLMDSGQFNAHMTEQVHPSLNLYARPKRLNDFYMHQTLQDSMYPDGSRFNMRRHEQVPVNIHDWVAVNSVSMTATSQPHLTSVELNQNWYTTESGVQDVWAPYESTVHSFSGGRNSDQSLFSVLSECNELRPAANYDPMSSSERFIQAGNYSGMGEGVPPSSLPQEAPNAFNYFNAHEAGAAGVKINNLGWMGIPLQNPAIHESSMGKPFLRSWNQ